MNLRVKKARWLLPSTLGCLSVAMASCSGNPSTMLLSDAGTGSDSPGEKPDTSPPKDSGKGGHDAKAGDGAKASDAAKDAGKDVVVSCEGGKVDCGGACVDTTTDPKNCGGCGVNCTGGSCTASVCDLFGGADGGCGPTPTVGDQACIGLDSKSVYWGTGLGATAGGAVYKVPVSGGCPALVIGSQANPHAVASDGTNLFWTVTDFTNNMGGIAKSDTSGGGMTMIVSAQPGHPYNIAIDKANVYWTQTDGSVWQVAQDGTGKTLLQPTSSGIGSAGAGYVTSGGGDVYWTQPGSPTGNVVKTPIGGGTLTTLASGLMGPNGIALDTKHVYWTDNGSGDVMELALGGTSPSTLASGQTRAEGMAVDGTNAYWSTFGSTFGTGTIAKAPLSGGSTTTLASSLNGPNCIALDSVSVYWIDNGGGLISKTGK